MDSFPPRPDLIANSDATQTDASMKKTNFGRLSKRYLAALRIHFAQGPPVDLQAAHQLGTSAVALGLETLDMARMHDHALAMLILPDSPSVVRYEMATRAALFFTEAIAPIEKTHRLAVKTGASLEKLKATLARHALSIADSNRKLQQEITQRAAAGKAVKASAQKSARLLKESRLLQKHLQDMARHLLTAHEDERRTMSLKLQDEIAQTLLGIQIRLLTLKKEVSDSDRGFKKEIAITQRLVEKSVGIINRFSREFGINNEN
jgi:signal transduction histidine kinase